MLSQSVARWIGLAVCPLLCPAAFWASLRVALSIAFYEMTVDGYIGRWFVALALMGISFGSVIIFFSIIAAGGP